MSQRRAPRRRPPARVASPARWPREVAAPPPHPPSVLGVERGSRRSAAAIRVRDGRAPSVQTSGSTTRPSSQTAPREDPPRPPSSPRGPVRTGGATRHAEVREDDGTFRIREPLTRGGGELAPYKTTNTSSPPPCSPPHRGMLRRSCGPLRASSRGTCEFVQAPDPAGAARPFLPTSTRSSPRARRLAGGSGPASRRSFDDAVALRRASRGSRPPGKSANAPWWRRSEGGENRVGRHALSRRHRRRLTRAHRHRRRRPSTASPARPSPRPVARPGPRSRGGVPDLSRVRRGRCGTCRWLGASRRRARRPAGAAARDIPRWRGGGWAGALIDAHFTRSRCAGETTKRTRATRRAEAMATLRPRSVRRRAPAWGASRGAAHVGDGGRFRRTRACSTTYSIELVDW